MMTLIRTILLLGLLAAVPVHGQDASAAKIKLAGPLVGHATSTTVSIWMFAGADSKVSLRFGLASQNVLKGKALFEAQAMPAKMIKGKPFIATLSDLKPQASYRFEILIDGKVVPDRAGQFQTAPPEGKPVKFRMGITSCMKTGQPQGSWKLFLDRKPDFHLTLGDTHYADSTDPDRQWVHHLRYRREAEFAAVISAMPTYAMWDDHDYGPNDSDGTARGKERSLKSWDAVWANPAMGTEKTPGAFFKFAWGDVDYFVLDGRYHRSPDKAKDDETKRMLGDAQFQWLIKGLKESKAKFKVLASGSTLHHSTRDGWRIYTFARHRLFDAIKENKISGVVYCSGDIHRSLVWEHPESNRAGYPIVEVISSGVANSKALSFATIEFDTTAADPTMHVQIIHGDGKTHDDKTWKLSQLKVK